MTYYHKISASWELGFSEYKLAIIAGNSKNLEDGKVGNIPIKIQVVDDEQGRKKGLMFRQSMPKNEGMLFIHDFPDVLYFSVIFHVFFINYFVKRRLRQRIDDIYS